MQQTYTRGKIGASPCNRQWRLGLSQQGSNGLQNTSCDVGKFREDSVKIGNYKKLCMPSGKRRLHFVIGRHYDDR